MNKSSLKIFFDLVTKPLDIPKSRVVPPEVFDAIYNLSAAWVIGRVVELWPRDQRYVEVVEPFLRIDIKQAVSGFVDLPTEYRNFLGAGVLTNQAKTATCSDTPQAIRLRMHELQKVEGICERVPIRIVDTAEFDFFTRDEFDMPTLKAPIGCFFGEKKLKICPLDVGSVEMRYLVNEKMYRYGYITQPDDTFIYDTNTSVETEFTNAAFDKLYAAATKLVGVYLRDNSVMGFSQALNELQFV